MSFVDLEVRRGGVSEYVGCSHINGSHIDNLVSILAEKIKSDKHLQGGCLLGVSRAVDGLSKDEYSTLIGAVVSTLSGQYSFEKIQRAAQLVLDDTSDNGLKIRDMAGSAGITRLNSAAQFIGLFKENVAGLQKFLDESVKSVISILNQVKSADDVKLAFLTGDLTGTLEKCQSAKDIISWSKLWSLILFSCNQLGDIELSITRLRESIEGHIRSKGEYVSRDDSNKYQQTVDFLMIGEKSIRLVLIFQNIVDDSLNTTLMSILRVLESSSPEFDNWKIVAQTLLTRLKDNEFYHEESLQQKLTNLKEMDWIGVDVQSQQSLHSFLNEMQKALRPSNRRSLELEPAAYAQSPSRRRSIPRAIRREGSRGSGAYTPVTTPSGSFGSSSGALGQGSHNETT